MGFFAKPAGQPRRRRRKGENAVYAVERSVTTTLLSGGKGPLSGRKKTKTTKEYRHGKCAVKHRSREAAARCPNP